MERRNNRSNKLIMWLVIFGDFVLLNAVLFTFSKLNKDMVPLEWNMTRMFYIISNFALLVGEWKFHTIIHQRRVSAGDVLRSIFMLTVTQMLISYILMRHMLYWMGAGWEVLCFGGTFLVLLVFVRLVERNIIKKMRQSGRNTRRITLVGSDKELWKVYQQIINDPTTGYSVIGYYADKDENEDENQNENENPNENENQNENEIKWLGTIEDLLEAGKKDGNMAFGDEMYVCLSRRKGDIINALSKLCDKQVTKFYYIPVSVESIGLKLEREYINDIEIFTTHESLLENPLNKAVKRIIDIVVSVIALIITGLLFPFVYILIKIQSPGPLFFKQLRTGINGKDFICYKFRSMHVNDNADKLQATKDDPRKFPFGNFMRKMNIDELPQFWNVLIGDMSVVGPRPHMLAHTDMYSRQIEEYMVRHFVRPGITGWAQVTGFRGETKELWQMEERVKRDIWYIENWSIWLDLRIIWMTAKSLFIHDKKAY